MSCAAGTTKGAAMRTTAATARVRKSRCDMAFTTIRAKAAPSHMQGVRAKVSAGGNESVKTIGQERSTTIATISGAMSTRHRLAMAVPGS